MITASTFNEDARGIHGICPRCLAGITDTDVTVGMCTQCGTAIRPPCPLCGGVTERASGAISEPMFRNGCIVNVARPGAWDQCRECEWAEEGHLQ